MLWEIREKVKFLITDKIFSYFGPATIRISPVGYACTNACPMCWRVMQKITKKGGLKETEMRYKQYEKIINSLSFATSTIEIVGGGEPLLFLEIENLLKKIKQKKKFGSLITNGVVLTKKISSTLTAIKWDLVRVSINSGTKEVYKEVNGSPYFDQTVKNVKTLISLRGINKFPRVGLHFVLQKGNYRDVKSFLKLAFEIGVDFISFDTLIYDSSNKIQLSNLELESLKNDLKVAYKTFIIDNNIKETLEKLKKDSLQRKRKYFSDKYCHIVQSNLDIDSEGIVTPCCMADSEPIQKKLENSSLSEIWKELSFFRKKLRQGDFEDFCYKKCNYLLNKKSSD